MPDTVVFDTDMLQALQFATEAATLLQDCKNGNIAILIPDIVLQQWSEHYADRLLSSYEDGLPNTILPLPEVLRQSEPYYKLVEAYWEEIFTSHGAIIIESNETHELEAQQLIDDVNTPFTADDYEDALIFCCTRARIAPADCTILCRDRKLSGHFGSNGYTVIRDPKDFIRTRYAGVTLESVKLELPTVQNRSLGGLDISQLIAAENSASTSFAESPTPAGLGHNSQRMEELLNAMAEQEKQIRICIAGYIHWLGPISKEELAKHMKDKRNYEKDIILLNSEQLAVRGIIKDIGQTYLPVDEEFCRQAGEAVMDEALEILDSL